MRTERPRRRGRAGWASRRRRRRPGCGPARSSTGSTTRTRWRRGLWTANGNRAWCAWPCAPEEVDAGLAARGVQAHARRRLAPRAAWPRSTRRAAPTTSTACAARRRRTRPGRPRAWRRRRLHAEVADGDAAVARAAWRRRPSTGSPRRSSGGDVPRLPALSRVSSADEVGARRRPGARSASVPSQRQLVAPSRASGRSSTSRVGPGPGLEEPDHRLAPGRAAGGRRASPPSGRAAARGRTRRRGPIDVTRGRGGVVSRRTDAGQRRRCAPRRAA